MMSYGKWVLVAVAASVFFVLQPVYAYENDGTPSKESGGWRKDHEWMEKKTQEIYSQLNLTDDQRKQLEDNKQRHMDQKKASFDQIRSYREALNQELMKPQLDMDKINQLQSQFKALQAQLTDDRLNSILEVRKILSLEQFSKFISLMEEHKHEGSQGETSK